MSTTHTGYLLIADITGYTRYLNESELEHAQETLTALLELLVDHTRPPLIISRLAGDAVISYGLKEDFTDRSSFTGIIEDTYVTFRKAINRLVLNNNCGCNACANISSLDLKFFIHFGSFGIQRIQDHDELVGSDINLIHRLLKNTVREVTGFRAYALYTAAAVRQLGIGDPAEKMTAHAETYEHLGEVNVWVQDLQPVWESQRADLSIEFPADRVWSTLEVNIDLPREKVWDYLVRPEFRNILVGADRMELANRREGRIAPGSVYQCYHGDKAIPQTILEIDPPERMLMKELSPMFPEVSLIAEYRLSQDNGTTHLEKAISKPSGPFPGRFIIILLSPLFGRMLQGTFQDFKQEIETDHRASGD